MHSIGKASCFCSTVRRQAALSGSRNWSRASRDWSLFCEYQLSNTSMFSKSGFDARNAPKSAQSGRDSRSAIRMMNTAEGVRSLAAPGNRCQLSLAIRINSKQPPRDVTSPCDVPAGAR